MPRATLILTAVLLASAASGCIVPEDMPALREELGYASVERPDLLVTARASSQTPTVDEPVELEAEIEGMPLDVLEVTWDVNGTTHEGPSTEVRFASAGTHPVQVQVEGPNGTQASDAIEIQTHPNRAPEPDLHIEDEDGLWASDPVVLRADGSTDPDGDELAYDWRLDDEPVDAGAVLETQLDPGPHHVEVSVSDGHASRSIEQSFAVDRRIQHTVNVSLTEDTAQLTVPVAASLDQAELTLTHTTREGLDQVNMTLQDGDGQAIATAVTDPGIGDSQASASLSLDGQRLEPRAHTLVVSLERGLESMATIEGVFTYSPLPSATG